MESVPLTLAYTHARSAIHETKRLNSVAASEEHDLAAAEFATAAQSTSDNEALRILRLLEQHHKKLGNLLKSNNQTPVIEASTSRHASSVNASSRSNPVSEPPRSTSPGASSQPPRLIRPSRHPARDLSSSIASNLASARGIPSHKQKRLTPISPLVSSHHADGFVGQQDASRKDASQKTRSESSIDNGQNPSRPSWAPPPEILPNVSESTRIITPVDSTASDAPFQQFYSTFEGLLSKLSAPLAFAGLPLTTPAPANTTNPPSSKVTSGAKQRAVEALQSSIDYSQLISRAALRAVRNDAPHAQHNPSESFYVVPTSGGTTSYAEIMSRAEREGARAFRDHRRNYSNASNDDFVDASSTILSPINATASKKISSDQKLNGKTVEEVALENSALKHLVDTLSKRLHVFEMSAQTNSAALAQSIRSLHLSPMATPENSRGKARMTAAITPDQIHAATSSVETERLNSRISELEEILRKSDARIRKREDENAKLRDTIVKYREKWDGLKAGAKARREKQAHSDGQRESSKKKDKSRSSEGDTSNDTHEKDGGRDDESKTAFS